MTHLRARRPLFVLKNIGSNVICYEHFDWVDHLESSAQVPDCGAKFFMGRLRQAAEVPLQTVVFLEKLLYWQVCVIDV